MRFCRTLHHVPDIKSSWLSDVMSAHNPPSDFISCMLFQIKENTASIHHFYQLTWTVEIACNMTPINF